MTDTALTSNAVQATAFTAAFVSDFQKGSTLTSPVYDVRNSNKILLLAAGTTITDHIIQQLDKRGVTRVLMSEADLQHMRSLAQNRVQDTAPAATPARAPRWAALSKRAHVKADSFLHELRTCEASTYCKEAQDANIDRCVDMLQALEQTYIMLIKGNRVSSANLTNFCNESLEIMAQDFDLFVSNSMSMTCGEYPYMHALQMSMLSMAMGTVLGLSRDELLQLGVGCLLHDVGMLFVDHTLVKSSQILKETEFLEVTKHPVRSYEILKSQSDLSNGSLMVAYQMHERFNGSGYPNGRQKNQTHRLARIASVADVFVALISKRPHRQAQMRYSAVDHILHETRDGLFDPDVTRALLETVSLFPVGSYVRLNDGRIGRVIRANLDAYTQPTVEVWQPDEDASAAEVVDLSCKTQLKITGPVDNLDVAG